MMNEWYISRNDAKPIGLTEIPVMEYGRFSADIGEMLADLRRRVVAYFAVPDPQGLKFYCLMADDTDSSVRIASHILSAPYILPSLTAGITAMHCYEREISELYGVEFTGNPWAKPLRFPFNRINPASRIDNYPFYDIKGAQLHLVNVGPVHAGIIEPGAFRFVCDGEQVLNLEIALGYQHRAVEYLISSTDNRLRQICLAESIAGDTTVGHSVAMARILENGEGDAVLNMERTIALEIRRIAMHVADTGALCTDIAYQIGQVACEALRTLVVNALQRWCGNRFGKGLIRPAGTHFPLTEEMARSILLSLEEVIRRFDIVAGDILSTPTVLARFEEVCTVTRNQAIECGAVGMAARSVGLERDSRVTHSFANDPLKEFITEPAGDLLARLRLRIREVNQSYEIIKQQISHLPPDDRRKIKNPDYLKPMTPTSLSFSLVEGWRGEICHVALTDADNRIGAYKIYDPSVHNWMMLALSLRGAQISDFPLSNKSYNLSYAGHDL